MDKLGEKEDPIGNDGVEDMIQILWVLHNKKISYVIVI